MSKSDCTIPGQARAILLEIGAWLRVNGEAIYGSRPWLVYGERPTTGSSPTACISSCRASRRMSPHLHSGYWNRKVRPTAAEAEV